MHYWIAGNDLANIPNSLFDLGSPTLDLNRPKAIQTKQYQAQKPQITNHTFNIIIFPTNQWSHDKLFKRLRLALIHNTPITLYIYKAFSIVYFLTQMKFIWVSNLDYIFLSYSCSYLSRPVAIQIQQMLKLKLADAQSNTVNIIIFPTNQLSPQRTHQTLELINKTNTYLVQT